MLVEEMTPEEVAYNWDLSLDEVTEAIADCEANREVLKQDAEAERRYLKREELTLSLRLLIDKDTGAELGSAP